MHFPGNPPREGKDSPLMQTVPPKKSAGRYTHIDLLECLGIFFVVFVHGTTYPYDYITTPSASAYLATFLRALLSCCVPLFFFANGYLLFGKPLDLKKHMKRLLRMVFLCFFWGSLLLLILQPIYGRYLTPKEFWTMLTNWEIDWINHLWYMGALVCIHVFFPLLKQAYDSNKKVFYYFVAICAILSFGNTFISMTRTVLGRVFLGERAAYYGINYFNMFNPFQDLKGYPFVYFCTGGICFSLEERIRAIPAGKRNLIAAIGLMLCCLGLGAICIYYSRVWKFTFDVIWGGFDTVFTFGIVIFVYVLSLNWKKDLPLIRLISSNTLGIYLLHVVPNWTVLPHIIHNPLFRNVPASFLYSLGILFFTLAVCLVLKKVPLIRKFL